MNKIIALSKVFKLDQNISDTKQKRLYDNLIAELKECMSSNYQGYINNINWEQLKVRHSRAYQKINDYIDSIAQSFLNETELSEFSIKGRHNYIIPVDIFKISVADFDFKDAGVFLIHCKSKEYFLLEKISSALVLKSCSDENEIIVVDFDDKDISITDYTQK